MSRPYYVQHHPVFRTGLVTAQNVAAGQVRVQFPDRGGVISWWLPVHGAGTQDDKAWWLPDIGEQVVVLMDEHDEYGSVVAAIYSAKDTPPRWAAAGVRGFQASDGAIVTYNRNTHTLTAQLPNGAAVNVSTGQGSKVVLGSDGTALMQDAAGAYVKATNDGNVHVNGNLLVAGTIGTASGSWGNGDMTVTGTIQATQDIVAGQGSQNISALNHTHGGVQVGSGSTRAPNSGT